MRTFALLIAIALAAAPLRADLEVHAHRDTVVLEDNSEIICIILMITEKGVLLVESDPLDAEKKTQRIIPRAQVRSILRDERNGAIEGLQTETELARKVVIGKGFRKEESAVAKAGGDEPSKGPGKGRGKIGGGGKKKAAADASPASPFAKDGNANGPGPFADALGKTDTKAPANGQDVKVDMPTGTLAAKELTDSYLTRFPELKSAGLELLGETQVQEWFDTAREGNDSTRKPLENILKAYLGTGEKDKTPGKNLRGEGTRPSRRPGLTPAPETPAAPAE